jgi:hypothetical protein
VGEVRCEDREEHAHLEASEVEQCSQPISPDLAKSSWHRDSLGGLRIGNSVGSAGITRHSTSLSIHAKLHDLDKAIKVSHGECLGRLQPAERTIAPLARENTGHARCEDWFSQQDGIPCGRDAAEGGGNVVTSQWSDHAFSGLSGLSFETEYDRRSKSLLRAGTIWREDGFRDDSLHERHMMWTISMLRREDVAKVQQQQRYVLPRTSSPHDLSESQSPSMNLTNSHLARYRGTRATTLSCLFKILQWSAVALSMVQSKRRAVRDLSIYCTIICPSFTRVPVVVCSFLDQKKHPSYPFVVTADSKIQNPRPSYFLLHFSGHQHIRRVADSVSARHLLILRTFEACSYFIC